MKCFPSFIVYHKNMGMEEQHEAIGRMVVSRAESQRHLEAIKDELRVIQQHLRDLGNAITNLTESPDTASTAGASPIDFESLVQQIGLDRLVSLVKGYYVEYAKQKHLTEALRSLGVSR
jgi:hypothetical protein